MSALKYNLAAVVDAIGVSNVGLVWGLANVNWQSEIERDNFLRALVNEGNGAS